MKKKTIEIYLDIFEGLGKFEEKWEIIIGYLK